MVDILQHAAISLLVSRHPVLLKPGKMTQFPQWRIKLLLNGHVEFPSPLVASKGFQGLSSQGCKPLGQYVYFRLSHDSW